MDLTQEEYDKQYQEAMAKLDAEAAGSKETATPSRAPNGQFTKAEETPAEVKQPEAAAPEAAKQPETAPEALPEDGKAPEQEQPDPAAEYKAEVERLKKQAADNKAWATKLAQELAEAKRERERQQREAMKPAVLEQHPELEEAIRYVAEAPKPVQPDPRQQWAGIIEQAHPGIFAEDADPELTKVLADKLHASNGAWLADPLLAIREITQEKIAFAERQAEKRAEAARQKAQQKSAMNVPGPGPSAPKPVDTAADEVKRIQNMSPAEFEKERRRVLGL